VWSDQPETGAAARPLDPAFKTSAALSTSSHPTVPAHSDYPLRIDGKTDTDARLCGGVREHTHTSCTFNSDLK